MSPEALCLCPPATEPPGRWQEAFPLGRALDEPALLRRLAEPAAATAIVWIDAGDPGWPRAVERLALAHPKVPIVLMTGVPGLDEATQAMQAGVRGYVHAWGVPDLLREVAVVVAHGGLWLGPELLRRVVTSAHDALRQRTRPESATLGATSGPVSGAPGPVAQAWARLTPREVEVARAVAAGRSNKEVADLLLITERTVKAHLGTIFEKLGVRDRLQLVLHLAAADERQSARSTGGPSA
jgi:DNA-binding NarL/FixJ family response regulator